MAELKLSLEQIFELDTDELYVTVGKEVIAEYRETIPGKIPPYLSAGKAWLRQKRKSLSVLICPNEHVQALLREKNVNRVLLATAVLDLFLSVNWTVAPATVAVLLVKEGIDSLCEDYVSHEEGGK